MYPGADNNRAKTTCLQQIQEISEIFENNEIKGENQKYKVNDDTEIVLPGDGPISFLLFINGLFSSSDLSSTCTDYAYLDVKLEL